MPQGRFVVGFLLFPRLTLLDLVGPYQVFSQTPGFDVQLIAKTSAPVPDNHGVCVTPTVTFETAPQLDLICVPGGPGEADAYEDESTLNFVRAAAREAQYITSVCTGSLILGAAGLLKGRRAACHWASRDIVRCFGGKPDPGRVVVDGNLITGGGVTAGIDFALKVVAQVCGPKVAQSRQLALEYAPAPPFDAGHPETAAAEVVSELRNAQREFLKTRKERARRAAQRTGA